MKNIVRKILIIVLIFIGICYSCIKISGKKTFSKIVMALKTKNIIINEKEYIIKLEECYSQNGHLTCHNLYKAIRKNYKFKSKYFENKKNYFLFFNKSIFTEHPDTRYVDWNLINAVEKFGLNHYILDIFIYDKSKGNDFEEIERIFKSNKKARIKYSWDKSSVKCEFDDKKIENEETETRVYQNEEYCSELFKKYFSTPRVLVEINWEEYMKMNKIYPELIFTDDNLTKEEVEELNEKIKPYFNKDLLNIIVEF